MTVATWASLGKDDLPAGTEVVVVAGPRTAFLAPESGALQKYLAAGGHALVLLDPVLPGPGSPPPDLGFAELLGQYGLQLGDDIVVDPANALPMVGAETVLANQYGTHPIVRPLSAESLPVVFPLARSVTKAEKPPDGVAETMLVETSAEGWGETNLKALAEGNGAIQKESGDTPGPVSIAVAVGPADEKRTGGKAARLVVIGNSRFATDGAIANGGNGILFANAIHWLTGSEKQIGIAPKTIEQASLSLTDSQVRRIGISRSPDCRASPSSSDSGSGTGAGTDPAVSARKLLALTAVVAVLFAFILLFERKMPSTAERQRKGNLYWDLPEDRLTGLTLTRGAETVEFARADGAAPWRMVKPDAYPADPFAVNSAASELTELKQASVDSAEARPEDYGLDHPVATAKLTWTEADEPSAVKSRTIEFGVDIPGTDITAARVAGQSTVLFVPSSALAAVKKPVDDFRSRDVFGGRSADVSRIEIIRGRGRLVLFRRDGAWWLSEPVADLADAAEADRLAVS